MYLWNVQLYSIMSLFLLGFSMVYNKMHQLMTVIITITVQFSVCCRKIQQLNTLIISILVSKNVIYPRHYSLLWSLPAYRQHGYEALALWAISL